MFDVIYYKNDTLVKVTGVRNSQSSSAINNATVQIVGIKEYGIGVDINPEMFPVTLNYEPNSVGSYSGILPNTLDLTPSTKYTCKVQIVTVENMQGYWEFTFTCRLRQD